MLGEPGTAFLVDGMKPAMETAAEENPEQSQERKGTGADNSLFRASPWGCFKAGSPACVSWKIAQKQSLPQDLALGCFVFLCLM